jgi:hydroxyquinol 1,2-dioxygenase
VEDAPVDLVDENTITEIAMRRWGTAKNPRLAKIMPLLIKHLHAFAREAQLTPEEWIAGIQWLTAVGQISDEKRMEGILASDVFGLSMLVVMMNARTPSGATPNTVLGPFHIDGSPEMAKDSDMSEGIEGEKLYVSGVVKGLDGKPIPNAVLDVWQADQEGSYEAQIPGAHERLRAIYRTDQDGRYGLWTIAPKGYAIPMDGPVGQLIEQTEISYYRPSHFHAMVLAEGYQPLVTHLFRQGAPYLENDVVFGVRQPLITPFKKHEPGQAPGGQTLDQPWFTADYDFVLAPAA